MKIKKTLSKIVLSGIVAVGLIGTSSCQKGGTRNESSGMYSPRAVAIGDLDSDGSCYSEIGVMVDSSTEIGLNEVKIVVNYEK